VFLYIGGCLIKPEVKMTSAQSKNLISKLHDKYYGKEKTMSKMAQKVAARAKELGEEAKGKVVVEAKVEKATPETKEYLRYARVEKKDARKVNDIVDLNGKKFQIVRTYEKPDYKVLVMKKG
jgi:hypothetical protein